MPGSARIALGPVLYHIVPLVVRPGSGQLLSDRPASAIPPALHGKPSCLAGCESAPLSLYRSSPATGQRETTPSAFALSRIEKPPVDHATAPVGGSTTKRTGSERVAVPVSRTCRSYTPGAAEELKTRKLTSRATDAPTLTDNFFGEKSRPGNTEFHIEGSDFRRVVMERDNDLVRSDR